MVEKTVNQARDAAASRAGLSRKKILVTAGVLVCLSSAQPACADSEGAWFAGGMLGGGGLAYGGMTLALPGATLGHGLAARLSGYYSDYQYFSGVARIKGEDSSGQLTALYQFSGAWGYSNLGVGAQYINTRLMPIDPGNKRRGARFDASLETDGAVYPGAWRADWYADYGVEQRDFQVQSGLTHSIGSSGLRLGVLGGVQGDPNYTRQQAGALAILTLESGFEVRVSGGVTLQSGRGNDGYVSLGFSQPF